MHVVTSALLLFTLHFLLWWLSQSKQVEVSLLHVADTVPREGLRYMLGVF